MTFKVESNEWMYSEAHRRAASTVALEVFRTLLADAEDFDLPFPVELTTAVNDDRGEKSRGSMISHGRHVIYSLTIVDGRKQTWDVQPRARARERARARRSAAGEQLAHESATAGDEP